MAQISSTSVSQDPSTLTVPVRASFDFSELRDKAAQAREYAGQVGKLLQEFDKLPTGDRVGELLRGRNSELAVSEVSRPNGSYYFTAELPARGGDQPRVIFTENAELLDVPNAPAARARYFPPSTLTDGNATIALISNDEVKPVAALIDHELQHHEDRNLEQTDGAKEFRGNRVEVERTLREAHNGTPEDFNERVNPYAIDIATIAEMATVEGGYTLAHAQQAFQYRFGTGTPEATKAVKELTSYQLARDMT